MPEEGQSLRRVLEKRGDVLRYLADSTARKPDIVSDMTVSRSTVDRAIRDLTEVDCVTQDGGIYEATTTGHVALAEYEQYRAATDSIRRSGELLNSLPAEAAVDPVVLEGASITLAEPHAPDQAVASTMELLEEATAMKGLAPVVYESYVSKINEQLERDDFAAEIVAEPDVVSTLSDFPGGSINPLANADAVSVYRADETLPYALWVIETPSADHAGITVYDSGGIVGVIDNDSEAAVKWTLDTYREYRKRAQQVSISSS